MGLHRGRKKIRFGNFLMLGRDMVLHCDEWKQLSPSAKVLYLYVKAKHNGTNNGLICLHYSEMATVRGFGSPSTVAKAFNELVKKGWITKTSKKWLHRTTNRYGLTGKYDDYITDRSHTVPEKYKEPTYYGVQKPWPIKGESAGPQISQPGTPSPSSTPTTESVATDAEKCS